MPFLFLATTADLEKAGKKIADLERELTALKARVALLEENLRAASVFEYNAGGDLLLIKKTLELP